MNNPTPWKDKEGEYNSFFIEDANGNTVMRCDDRAVRNRIIRAVFVREKGRKE